MLPVGLRPTPKQLTSLSQLPPALQMHSWTLGGELAHSVWQLMMPHPSRGAQIWLQSHVGPPEEVPVVAPPCPPFPPVPSMTTLPPQPTEDAQAAQIARARRSARSWIFIARRAWQPPCRGRPWKTSRWKGSLIARHPLQAAPGHCARSCVLADRDSIAMIKPSTHAAAVCQSDSMDDAEPPSLVECKLSSPW